MSAWAVDWDADGDLDLLLGSYGGRLYRQMNEGTATEPAFTGSNLPVMIGAVQLEIEGGLTAPRACDWNGDGLFDLVCGGVKGGVYLFVNGGEAGKPAFQPAQTLIPAGEIVDSPLPESGVYADPIDYDGDGDLDLLVGGFTEWEGGLRSAEAQAHVDELRAEMKTLEDERAPLAEQLRTTKLELQAAGLEAEAIQARLEELDIYAELETMSQGMRAIWQELEELGALFQRTSYIWLYRRVEPASDE